MDTLEERARAVIDAERALAAAHLTLDIATFDRLLHPEYVILQPGGAVENKADTIASLQTGDRHWEVAESDQFDVRIYGDTAIVSGRWRGRGRHGDQAFDYAARFLSVWVCEAGQWRNVAFQSTEIAS